MPGIHLTGTGADVVLSIVLTLLNAVLSELVGTSDDDAYYGTLVRQLVARNRHNLPDKQAPGMLVVQIDGLSRPVLDQALRSGRAPAIDRLVVGGESVLRSWVVMLPSVTPASQAGILHGRNDGIPGFRWYEKASGRLFVANHPRDAAEILARLSDGTGLLAEGGTGIGNLMTGDADRSYLTMATIEGSGEARRHVHPDGRRLHGFFVNTVNYLRLVILMLGEAAKEVYQAERERSSGIVPRMRRGLGYALERAVTNVALRNVSTALVIEELFAGTPIVYVDYTGYDAIAHHSGPERPEAMDALAGLDRAIGSLLRAIRDATRPYRLVILSDHGQTLGRTFRQHYDYLLEDRIAELMGPTATHSPVGTAREYQGSASAVLSELGREHGLGPAIVRAAPRIRRSYHHGAADQPAGGGSAQEGSSPPGPDVVVCASGNLALVYFTLADGRLSLEAIEARYPGLPAGLVLHPGVGLVLAMSDVVGPVVLGRSGRAQRSAGVAERCSAVPARTMSTAWIPWLCTAPTLERAWPAWPPSRTSETW